MAGTLPSAALAGQSWSWLAGGRGAALRSGGEVAEEVIDKVARAGAALAAG
jgi:hypothetical protein